MPASSQPIDLMFSAYRRKVLAVLMLRPDEDFHVRELERLTGCPPDRCIANRKRSPGPAC